MEVEKGCCSITKGTWPVCCFCGPQLYSLSCCSAGSPFGFCPFGSVWQLRLSHHIYIQARKGLIRAGLLPLKNLLRSHAILPVRLHHVELVAWSHLAAVVAGNFVFISGGPMLSETQGLLLLVRRENGYGGQWIVCHRSLPCVLQQIWPGTWHYYTEGCFCPD